MYYDGRGVPQDYKQSVMWFRKAAEQGDMDAQYNLGHMYHGGRGVPQDYKQAYAWASTAAANGEKNAFYL
ncbi:tetratricopeptide repeat protein, partial [Aeromonas caviae]|uniref:tetratricopeptide repeat protein n=1 Tax=Aeromonas caviae TaxID=648 RepID=UPI0035A254E7